MFAIIVQYTDTPGTWGYGTKYLRAARETRHEAIALLSEICDYVESKGGATGDLSVTSRFNAEYRSEWRDAEPYVPETEIIERARLTGSGPSDIEVINTTTREMLAYVTYHPGTQSWTSYMYGTCPKCHEFNIMQLVTNIPPSECLPNGHVAWHDSSGDHECIA